MLKIERQKVIDWGLGLLILLIPFQIYFKLYGHIHISVAQVLMGILFVVWLWKRYLNLKIDKNFKLVDSPLNIPVIFLVSVMIISVCISTNILESSKYAIKWISFITLYFIVVDNIKEWKQIKYLIIIIMITGIFLAILGIVEYSLGAKKMLNFVSTSPIAPLIMEPDTLNTRLPPGNSFNWYLRIKDGLKLRAFGTFISVVTFSAYLGLIIPLVMGWIHHKMSLKQRVFWGGSLILMLYVLVLTITRSAWLGLGVAITFMALIKKRLKSLLLFCILVGVLIFISWLIFPGFIITLKGRFFLMFKPTSQMGRITYWLAALKIIKTQPVFGVGLANYKYGFAKYVGDIGLVSHSAHSNYLQIGAEMGLLGLASFIWIIITGIQTSWRIFKSTINRDMSYWGLGFLGVWIWFVVQSFFSPYFFGNKYSMLFWIVAGLNMCVYRLCKRQIGDKSSE